jgi:hypothetical protein
MMAPAYFIANPPESRRSRPKQEYKIERFMPTSELEQGSLIASPSGCSAKPAALLQPRVMNTAPASARRLFFVYSVVYSGETG